MGVVARPPTHTHTRADAGDMVWVCGCMHLVDLQRSSQNLTTHTHTGAQWGHQVCFIFIVTETVDNSFHRKQHERERDDLRTRARERREERKNTTAADRSRDEMDVIK